MLVATTDHYLLPAAVPKQSQSQRMATAKRVYLPSAVEAAVMSMKQLHADALPQSSRAQPVAASRSRTASERAAPTSVDATVQKSGAVSTGQHPASQTTKTGIQSSAAENGWKQQGCENSTDKGIATHTLSHNDKDDRESGDAASDMTRAQKAKADCTHTGLVILQQVLKADVLDVDKLNATYRKVIEAYRTGLLGRYTLDL